MRTTTILASVLILAGATHAADMTVTVGEHPFPFLASVKPDQPLNPEASYILTNGQQKLPAQADTDGRLWWYQPACKGEACSYKLQEGADSGSTGRVQLGKVGDGLIEVRIAGERFTALNYASDLPKPFLYPVIGPTGAHVTRQYPMKNIEGERHDHPHHRSIWTAHGDVRLGKFDEHGTDYWAQGSNKGLEKVTRIVRTASGPVFGLIEADIDWVTPAGKKELSETRTYRFYRTTEDERIIDVRVVFKFTEGDVMFADTKEGGILSLRVATSMDEESKKGGKMVNSRGQVGEEQCWGQPAEWCDYVGPVDGQTVGIAVFDAKANFRHPTRWHIRGYGLYTANPFMAGSVTSQQKKKNPDVKVLNDSHTWKKGDTEEFNYRVLIHKGDTKAGRVAEHYRAYAEPPKLSLK